MRIGKVHPRISNFGNLPRITRNTPQAERKEAKRPLSPFSACYAFSWHSAAKQTADPSVLALSSVPPGNLQPVASSGSGSGREGVKEAAGKPKRVSGDKRRGRRRRVSRSYAGPGPLEQGVIAAESGAYYINTPDPLRLDPMRTLGSAPRRSSTSSQAEVIAAAPATHRDKDPLNHDPVRYAISPLSRMGETATDFTDRAPFAAPALSEEGHIRAGKSSSAERRRETDEVAVELASKPAGKAKADESSPEERCCKHSSHQATGEGRQDQHRCGFHTSCSKSDSQQEQTRRQICEELASSTCALSRSSTSLDVYQLLKARSRTRHGRRHEGYAESAPSTSNQSLPRVCHSHQVIHLAPLVLAFDHAVLKSQRQSCLACVFTMWITL